MSISDEAFAGLLAIVDRHAGRAHSSTGSVANALREVLTAHEPLIAPQERERVARYIDRAVAGKRETAALGLLADTIVADAWAEVADWLREASIWCGDDGD